MPESAPIQPFDHPYDYLAWWIACTFSVLGQPITQGSKQPRCNQKTGTLYVQEDRAKVLRPWRALLHDQAQKAVGDAPPLEGPIRLELDFWVPRPASAPKRRRTFPLKKGSDIDKLERAILDSLSKVVYRDDSQVVEVRKRKDFATTRPPGVDIRVWITEETP